VTFPDVRGGKNMRSTTTPRKRGVGGLRAGRVLTTLLAVCWSVSCGRVRRRRPTPPSRPASPPMRNVGTPRSPATRPRSAR
jgi:hypothetical protein